MRARDARLLALSLFWASLPAAGAATPADTQGEPSMPVEQMMKLRDPFKRPLSMKNDSGVPKTPLEMHAVDRYKVIGILTGPSRMRAVLIDPEGKNYIVSERMKIGLRDGAILKIYHDRVRVREKIKNILGQVENLDTDIVLNDGKAKGGTVSTTSGASSRGGGRVQ